jgi:hypothetical protein
MDDSLGNRKHKRNKDQLDITVDGKKGCTVNIGLGGALALVECDIPLMEEVVIDITLPTKIVRVSGTCLRSSLRGSSYQVALFFDETSFSRDDKEELQKYTVKYQDNKSNPLWDCNLRLI